jgi:hypothetical protein
MAGNRDWNLEMPILEEDKSITQKNPGNNV